MDEEHLEVWQVAEFILDGLDDDELEGVYRHFDECGECAGWLAGVVRVSVGLVSSRPGGVAGGSQAPVCRRLASGPSPQ